MSTSLILFISKYGYLAIFLLVFLQEVGAPNPIPNELVLLFSGYLTFTGELRLALVILATITADFIGSCMLHTIFYYSGNFILEHKPKWLPIPTIAINNLTKRISKNGLGGIFLLRLSPFVRGYTSVISGLLQIKHKIFMPLALITAFIWSAAYIITGKLLGALYGNYFSNLNNFKYYMLFIFLLLITIILICLWRKAAHAKTKTVK